jgi:hypothetical protein
VSTTLATLEPRLEHLHPSTAVNRENFFLASLNNKRRVKMLSLPKKNNFD